MNCSAGIFIVFIFGALLGSFLNVCIYRMPRKESIILPPSHCPKCNTKLCWYDNIPIISFLILAGRCRYCKTRISFRYPLVELLTALLLAALFIGFGTTPKFFAYSIMTCGLIVAAFVDFKIQEIPDFIWPGGFAVGISLAFLFPSILGSPSRMHALAGSLAGAATGAGSIFIIKIFGTFIFEKKVKELGLESAMGNGDIMLMAMVGTFLGWKLALFTFFIAPIFGVAGGIFLRIKDGREIIPYGPYLSLAAIISIFFGNRLLDCLFYRI